MERPTIILLEDPDGFPENVGAVIHLDDKATRVGPGMWRKRILRYGKWSHDAAPDGVLDVDESYGQKLVRNFADKVFDSVQTIKGHPKNDAERIAFAAGQVVALDDAGGEDGPGVYATIQVPDAVDQEIAEGKVLGCSAGIIPNYADHELGGKGNVGPVLEHLALTNTPYIKGLGGFSPVHLAANTPSVLLSLGDAVTKEHVMDRKELIEQAKALGIDIEELETSAAKLPELETKLADATKAPTPDEITAAQTEAKEIAKGELAVALGEAFAGAGLITLADGQKPDLGSLVKTLGEQLANGKNAAQELRLSEATHAVDAAIKDGRIIPGKNEDDGSNKVRDANVKLYLSDKETWETLLPKTPLVDLSEYGTTGADDDGITLSDGAKSSDEVTRLLALAEDLGI